MYKGDIEIVYGVEVSYENNLDARDEMESLDLPESLELIMPYSVSGYDPENAVVGIVLQSIGNFDPTQSQMKF